uniref:Camphor 5-monooxygenase n=1 Tax=Pseudomonas putida TaxID=303 RepID=UPI00038478DB|nr:Chain A, Camphor 5-monooxygenase [Pseudomonas putida]4L4C_B Chain B, Camphor 5-monooxygenase [Pseudomonas putida]4L4G_A Chain A, Camphor 5-monooxygenase [Pseudomonas putida]
MTTETIQSNANLAPLPPHVPEHLVFDFDMYNPSNLSAGVQEAWAVLQESNVPDLVWTRCNGGHWIATRGQLIREAYEDYRHFSSECPFIPREAGEAYDFIPTSMDPPEQRQFRALANQVVGMPVVDKLENRIQELACSLIESLRPQGQCNFTEDYAEPFPIRIFMLLAGLPEEDIPHLGYLTDQMTRPDGSMTFAEAKEALYDYLIPIIEQRRQKPGTDAISIVANGQVNGRPITSDEAKRMCGLLLVGGLDTVVNFLSFSMEFLAKSPEHRQELIERPERIPAACEELLRRFSLVADGRILTSDYEFHGVQLKKGDQILLPQMLSGLDERENAAPMHVDFSRQKVSHTTFGHGSHLCPGQHLARREIIVTLKEWLTRIPDFSIAPGAQIQHKSGIVSGVQALPLVWDPATTKAV